MRITQLLFALIFLPLLGNAVAAQSTNCTLYGVAVDLSWFQLQSIGERSLIVAYLSNHATNSSALPQCAISNLSNQQITFYADGKEFLSPVYTNTIGAATLGYNTSILGMGDHSVYALWNRSGAYSRSPVENIQIVKRVTSITYNMSISSSGFPEITALLSTCSQFINNVTAECAAFSNQTIDFYFDNNFIGLQKTNGSGIAQEPYNTSGLAPGNYSVFFVYNGDANDTSSSTQGSFSVGTRPVSPVIISTGRVANTRRVINVPSAFGETLIATFALVFIVLVIYRHMHGRHHARKMAEKEGRASARSGKSRSTHRKRKR